MANVPLRFVARFVGEPGQEDALNALFGGERWRATLPLSGEMRERCLRDCFAAGLREGSGIEHVRAFEVRSARGTSGYHLFFASGHRKGMAAMKAQWWREDPHRGTLARPDRREGQLRLDLPPELPELAPLRAQFLGRYRGRCFRFDDAITWALTETDYLDKHLRAVCRELEAEDLIRAVGGTRKKARTYPAGAEFEVRAGSPD